MSQTLSYAKITDARAAIADIYDSAGRNLVVDITREDDAPVAVIRKDALVSLLHAKCTFDPKLHFSDDGYVSMWLEGLPISAEGSSLEDAETELIASLRDFTQTWLEDLREYPNHRSNWALPTLVRLSTDEELRKLVFGNE
jgi:hypothetical protein